MGSEDTGGDVSFEAANGTTVRIDIPDTTASEIEGIADDRIWVTLRQILPCNRHVSRDRERGYLQ